MIDALDWGSSGHFSLTFLLELRYTAPMKKSLLETNPYLINPKKREEAMARNIETSSAIEGIMVKRNAKTGCFVHADKVTVHSKATQTSRSRH